MSQPQAIFLDKASLYPADLDFSSLQNIAQWAWFDNADVGDVASDDLRSGLRRAEILVANKTTISRKLIGFCDNLKLIVIAATGVNNVDLDAAKKYGVKVCNVQAYATASVTQHVFSLILSLNRKLPSYNKRAIDGSWSQSDFFCYFDEPFSDLGNKVLGIIGYGELGRAVEKVALSFGMKVLVAESHNAQLGNNHSSAQNNRRVEIKKLLTEADIVSLHCPLTQDNKYMIAAREFAMMKKRALIINTARGGLIDEKALLVALENNEIAGAGLDVLEQEPPAKDNALINYVQNANNLIITPHIAWASQQARQNLVNQIAENIRAYQIGQARNLIV